MSGTDETVEKILTMRAVCSEQEARLLRFQVQNLHHEGVPPGYEIKRF
jgi:hypothetical protein